VLLELPHVLDGARKLVADYGISDRSRLVAGDFLRDVPVGDAHILKNIVHDWDDERAVRVLRNCRAATHGQGRVLIVQEVLPSGDEPSFGKLMDIQMLLFGGRERTEPEYRALLDRAGYELTRVVPAGAVLHVIEAMAR
jgi:hypothetical protein